MYFARCLAMTTSCELLISVAGHAVKAAALHVFCISASHVASIQPLSVATDVASEMRLRADDG